jgi:hypothetical protein
MKSLGDRAMKKVLPILIILATCVSCSDPAKLYLKRGQIDLGMTRQDILNLYDYDVLNAPPRKHPVYPDAPIDEKPVGDCIRQVYEYWLWMPSKEDDLPFLLVFENCTPEQRDHLEHFNIWYSYTHMIRTILWHRWQ